MPTPLHVFNEIAARYGANPHDRRSVRSFYNEAFLKLPLAEQEEIVDELIARDGESGSPSTNIPQP